MFVQYGSVVYCAILYCTILYSSFSRQSWDQANLLFNLCIRLHLGKIEFVIHLIDYEHISGINQVELQFAKSNLNQVCDR